MNLDQRWYFIGFFFLFLLLLQLFLEQINLIFIFNNDLSKF